MANPEIGCLYGQDNRRLAKVIGIIAGMVALALLGLIYQTSNTTESRLKQQNEIIFQQNLSLEDRNKQLQAQRESMARIETKQAAMSEDIKEIKMLVRKDGHY